MLYCCIIIIINLRFIHSVLHAASVSSMDAAGAGGREPVFTMQQQVTTLPFPPSPPLTPYYYSSLSSSSPESAASHHASLSITSLPILLLTMLGILTASALLLAYYVFVIRCCLTWHGSDSFSDASHSRRRRGRPGGADLPVVRGALAEARGLEAPAIQALPAFRYRKAAKNDAAVESGECAVCLGEFQEEERVRLLPGCLHVFHADCIDTWLHGNANCPLCRAAITTTTTTGGQLPLMDQVLRPEDVVIQVQVAGTEEEANTAAAGSQGGAADQRVGSKGDECIAERKKISKNNTRFYGDGSDSSSSSTF